MKNNSTNTNKGYYNADTIALFSAELHQAMEDVKTGRDLKVRISDSL